MTRYEQELRKLFENSSLMECPQFSGRVCVGMLGKDLRVRAEFFSAHTADRYDAIRLTVLNRTEGVVDRTLLLLKDVWGKKSVPGNPNFRNGILPYLWDDRGDVDWYVYHPNAADYDLLRQSIGQYLSIFRERTQERSRGADEPERQKPPCPMVGQDGNIFGLIGLASRTLRKNNMAAEANEMQERIMSGSCHSYGEALKIISEYVETELSPTYNKDKKKEKHTHER